MWQLFFLVLLSTISYLLIYWNVFQIDFLYLLEWYPTIKNATWNSVRYRIQFEIFEMYLILPY